MTKELNETFRNYIKIVQSNFPTRNNKIKVRGPLRLLENKAMMLRDLVYQLESSEEFEQLIVRTQKMLQGSRNHYWTLHAAQNFYRRSGFYINIFEENEINIDKLFNLYCDQFSKEEVQVRYLIPLDCVRFGSWKIDFKSFCIKRFTEDELNEILEVNINKIFYPYAITNIEMIKNYWYIDLTKLESKKGETKDIESLGITYKKYPEPIDSILKQLILYDWQQISTLGEDTINFWAVPFWFCKPSNLLAGPSLPPDYSKLWIDLMVNDQTNKEEYFPYYYLSLDNDQTAKFNETLQYYIDLYEGINFLDNNWHFFERAVGYFYKGFLSSMDSDYKDPILYYIIALESLLGERKEGLRERLGSRIGCILGNSERERKAIKKQFGELYDFRCDYVHGNLFNKKVHGRHTLNAYNLCRGVIIWFLHFLSKIHSGLPPNLSKHNIPTRDDILKLLDQDQTGRIRVRKLIDILPDEFPNVSNWV